MLRGFSRRQFIKMSGISALGLTWSGLPEIRSVSIVVDPKDAVAGSPPVQWASQELEESLTLKGITVHRFETLKQSPDADLCIVVSGSVNAIAGKILKQSGAVIPSVPEALGIIKDRIEGKEVLLACGYDVRGAVYAILELADRVRYARQPLDSLNFKNPVIEKPANKIRGINRLFVSDVEDKPWYNDRGMWPGYLTHLATQRFNRFSLSMGIGYDFLSNVTDSYFLFAYPFLLDLPGYNVRATGLADSERDNNLKMLKFISEQTVARGMEFQLGLWMHGYQLITSPNANHTIEGLTPENHGAYCRDAVRELLKSCPAISGITFRIHGESGVTEGSYDFWKTVFDGVATCGRTVRLDMHAKGIDQKMIDNAVATGLPVTVSPKYWAEHLGMPYHQADIRSLEIPQQGKQTTGLMNLSTGSRSFIRYGYGDLLRNDRHYNVLHRIWPGTQRLLLWGDPVFCAAYSRAFSFCGSAGSDLMEPLSFKGRQGSGIAGDRCGYSDLSLRTRWDWEKFLYSIRVYGRLLYNPDSDPDVWHRYLQDQFGNGAKNVEGALANASRILPVVLTAHGPSAANNAYWPEMYTNQAIVNPQKREPYGDTPSPKVFGNVSPFDPQLFLGINDFTNELLSGERSGKYTPIDAAQWIEDFAGEALKNLEKARLETKDTDTPEFRRFETDVLIQVGLGRFFGSKFRAGVLYGIWSKSRDREALEEALKFYRIARDYWADLSDIAGKVYLLNVSVGQSSNLKGHWTDRLPAIDEDIADMVGKLELSENIAANSEKIRYAVKEAIGRQVVTQVLSRHISPGKFNPGQELKIELSSGEALHSVSLFYRHVNHAERYQVKEMAIKGNLFHATIPAEYTVTQYPIQYYFAIKTEEGKSLLYPGFKADLMSMPYYVVQRI